MIVIVMEGVEAGLGTETENERKIVLVMKIVILFHAYLFYHYEIIGVKNCHRQTDKFFDTIHGGMQIFSFS